MPHSGFPRIQRPAGWLAWGAGLLLLILVPFLLYQERVTGLVTALQQPSQSRWVAAGALAGLLAADVVLPIPSSLTSIAIGALAGFWWGTAISAVSMTIACIAGHFLGRSAGRGTARWLVGERELQRAGHILKAHGDWMIVALRGVPVLAEGSVVLAGTAHMPFARFLFYCAIGNLTISAVYAAVGVAVLRADLALACFVAVQTPLLIVALRARRAPR